MRRFRFLPSASLLLLPLLLAACTSLGGFGGGSKNAGDAPKTADGQVDLRRYIGPDYCPELRVKADTQTIRRFARGKEETADNVVWQAGLGDTARECLYDTAGNVTIRIGVAGRVLAGPQGGPTSVEVPVRVVIVKNEENVLASELYRVPVTIGPELSAVFSQVYELTVPSPGQDRDYIIYVGFDEEAKR
ncbi:hypothetical protein [Afifella sp. IM 167]|uniref:hypothetical protein n=1 Tax=Afifella sp. IM 167 TaxID=2033586 RepID=UPI001CD02FBE|nr:hypothetical protein [Afifella sp. IM 167]MBZ8133349.1 hypothetical protein [Afifella sp. IM 167]